MRKGTALDAAACMDVHSKLTAEGVHGLHLLITAHAALPVCSGRKKASLLYVILYAISCATKHSSDYWWVRTLAGVRAVQRTIQHGRQRDWAA